MPDDTEKAKAGKKLPGQSDDARNKFYDDNPDVPEVEATASSASRDRRIVTWAPEEPEKEERQIQIWDGRLKPPPAPKEVVVTGKKKKAGPAGFASGAAVSMTELPQFTNTKKQAIKHFAAAEEKTPVKDLGECSSHMATAGLPVHCLQCTTHNTFSFHAPKRTILQGFSMAHANAHSTTHTVFVRVVIMHCQQHTMSSTLTALCLTNPTSVVVVLPESDMWHIDCRSRVQGAALLEGF